MTLLGFWWGINTERNERNGDEMTYAIGQDLIDAADRSARGQAEAAVPNYTHAYESVHHVNILADRCARERTELRRLSRAGEALVCGGD